MEHRTRKKIPITFWIILVLIALLAELAVLFFAVNRWSVTITMNGDSAVVLEYGDSYQDPGAEARLHGSLFFREGWPMELAANSNVDANAVGEYTVTYTARKLLWAKQVTRTVTVQDTCPPEITLISSPDHCTLPGEIYEEEGYQATDNCDGDLTQFVQREERDGVVYYSVEDSSGNRTEVIRTIQYGDSTPPELALLGDAAVTLTAGTAYAEPGWTANDNCDGDLTNQVQVSGAVNSNQAGTYELTYTVTDQSGNVSQATRAVTVEPVQQAVTVTPNGKVIYLTFDDGPGPYTQQLLDVLAKYNVKVTFFTVNTKYNDLIAAEVAAGHSVGIHSATHDYPTIYASEDAYFADLQKQQDIIYQQTGEKTTLLRFPGGSSNTVSKNYCPGIMSKLTQDVTDQGFQYFDWNVSSGDAGETTDTETVYQNVIQGVQQHDVSVVLQHDIKEFSVNAVEKIIVWGLENGYTFLPLDATSPTAHHRVNN